MKKHLIVGLGNIGEKYTQTRHNIGFEVVEKVTENLKGEWKNDSFGSIFKTSYKGRPTYFLKPDTFMNLSGNAVLYWKKKLDINNENILIITDDLHLEFGTLRLKEKGSNAGHNGLKNIEEKLQTTQYPRLRFGIGNKFEQGKQVDFVLNKFSEEEQQTLADRTDVFAKATLSFIFAGIKNTMNLYNGK